ncbi:MAG: prepilin-type N-terminal cleavage/methylation domain-containing protein [Anaerohalosphaera sp.]|nr:prepilin-type N-terminal cleavage/methylation domain-containing protein [Anaerohalosphaera sp.]
MKNRKGVTLIELLIVVLILAALSAIAIPRISQSATNAKAKSCATNIDILNSAIELYNAENDAYPTNLTTITGDTSLFPDGAPVCPITGEVYSTTLSNNRVNATSHSH